MGKKLKMFELIEPKTVKEWKDIARICELAKKFAMDNNCAVITRKQNTSNFFVKNRETK
jgi:hypothetical protein